MANRIFKNVLIVLFCGLLSACGTTRILSSKEDGPPQFNVDVSNIPNAVPKVEPFSKYGNPPSYVALGRRYCVMKSNRNYHERGIASWYGTKFHAKRTSSGEPYNMLTMTAAHKTLPIPTYAHVTNLENGRHIIVKINDRGPFSANRIIDLSYAAAKKLGITGRGTGLVQVDSIDARTWRGEGHQSYFVNHVPLSEEPSTKKSERYCSKVISSEAHPIHGKALLYSQLGAFGKIENAQALMKKLKHYTKRPIRIKTARMNGHAVYRVQIGPLKNVAESDHLNSKIRHLNLGNPITQVE